MTWLDDERGKHVNVNGVNLPDRKNITFTAPGATASDSESQNRTTVDLTGLSLPQYDSMTLLRAVNPVDGRVAYTRGYSSPVDGGGGTWQGVTGAAPGTYTHNGGTVIVPVGGDGSAAWVREYGGAISVKWFGATGDGATDDTFAIQAAITGVSAMGGGGLLFPGGNVFSFSPSTAPTFESVDDVHVIIDSNADIQIDSSGSYVAFYFKVCNRVRVSGGGTVTGRSAFTGQLFRFEGCLGVNFDGPIAKNAGTDGIYVTRSSGQQAENHIIVARVKDAERNGVAIISCEGGTLTGYVDGVSGSAPEAGVQIEPESTDEVNGFTVHGMSVKNCAGNGIAISGDLGSNYNEWGVKNITIAGCSTSGNGTSAGASTSSGIYMGSCEGCSVVGHSSNGDRYGFMMAYARGCSYSGTVDAATVFGAQVRDTWVCDLEITSTGSGAEGVLMSGACRQTRVRGSLLESGADGLAVASDCAECDIQVIARDNADNAVLIEGASNYVTNCDLRGAGTGGLQDSGYDTRTVSANRTNADFVSSDLTTWTTVESTLAAGIAGPFGSNDAYRLSDNAVNAAHRLSVSPAGIDTSADAVFEIIGKADTLDEIWVSLDGAASGSVLNLSNGLVTPGGVLNAESSQDLGDGWWRLRLVYDSAAISGGNVQILTYNGANAYSGSNESVLLHSVRVLQ